MGEVESSIGSWVGEALASDLGEDSASKAYSNLTSEFKSSEYETSNSEVRGESGEISDYKERLHSLASTRAR